MSAIMCSLFLTLSLAACSDEAIGGTAAIIFTPATVSQESNATVATQKPTKLPAKKPETEADNSMYQIQIAVGNQTFSAVLYKNKTTDALIARLPLTLEMGDLNGNEKFYYFSESLPVDSKRPGEIHAGDLMLYGSDCLVLFYESFSSSFSYTSLGYVEDADGLANAVGSGKVLVSFDVQ